LILVARDENSGPADQV